MKRGSVLFSSLCHRRNGKVCDVKSACWASVMKRPCLLPLGEGSEKCSVWMDPREEKGEGQRQAWWAEKGRVDNRHPVWMAPECKKAQIREIEQMFCSVGWVEN